MQGMFLDNRSVTWLQVQLSPLGMKNLRPTPHPESKTFLPLASLFLLRGVSLHLLDHQLGRGLQGEAAMARSSSLTFPPKKTKENQGALISLKYISSSTVCLTFWTMSLKSVSCSREIRNMSHLPLAKYGDNEITATNKTLNYPSRVKYFKWHHKHLLFVHSSQPDPLFLPKLPAAAEGPCEPRESLLPGCEGWCGAALLSAFRDRLCWLRKGGQRDWDSFPLSWMSPGWVLLGWGEWVVRSQWCKSQGPCTCTVLRGSKCLLQFCATGTSTAHPSPSPAAQLEVCCRPIDRTPRSPRSRASEARSQVGTVNPDCVTEVIGATEPGLESRFSFPALGLGDIYSAFFLVSSSVKLGRWLECCSCHEH